MDPRAEGLGFVERYYTLLDQNMVAVADTFYASDTLMTFEREQVGEHRGDVQKNNLPHIKTKFEAFKEKFTERLIHQISPEDIYIQVASGDGILVQVTGKLQEFGQPAPFSFVQTFQIKYRGQNLQPGQDAWWIHNDMFQLVWPA